MAFGRELWNDRRNVPLFADGAMTRSKPKTVPVDDIGMACMK